MRDRREKALYACVLVGITLAYVLGAAIAVVLVGALFRLGWELAS